MYRLEINDAEIDQAFASLAASLSDLTQPMGDIGELMVHSTQSRMLAGLSPDGTAFAPRSRVTLAQYARKGLKPGAQPLWLTGRMRQTIAHQHGSDYVQISSNAIQAAVMQFGAEQGAFGATMGRTKPSAKRPKSQDYFAHLPWGDIPARPFLGLSEQDRGDVLDILAEWLETAR